MGATPQPQADVGWSDMKYRTHRLAGEVWHPAWWRVAGEDNLRIITVPRGTSCRPL